MSGKIVYMQQMWKKGHWERTYRSKLVSEVTEDDGHNKHYYLGSVNSISDDDDEWTLTLDIENKPVKFKIDSGADCSVMSETV